MGLWSKVASSEGSARSIALRRRCADVIVARVQGRASVGRGAPPGGAERGWDFWWRSASAMVVAVFPASGRRRWSGARQLVRAAMTEPAGTSIECRARWPSSERHAPRSARVTPAGAPLARCVRRDRRGAPPPLAHVATLASTRERLGVSSSSRATTRCRSRPIQSS